MWGHWLSGGQVSCLHRRQEAPRQTADQTARTVFDAANVLYYPRAWLKQER